MNESEIMSDFDVEKYNGKYCKKMKCTACDGTDFNGEPNGYGCEGNDNYIESRYQSIYKRRLKKLRLTASWTKFEDLIIKLLICDWVMYASWC